MFSISRFNPAGITGDDIISMKGRDLFTNTEVVVSIYQWAHEIINALCIFEC